MNCATKIDVHRMVQQELISNTGAKSILGGQNDGHRLIREEICVGMHRVMLYTVQIETLSWYHHCSVGPGKIGGHGLIKQ